jgi:N-acetylmuramoyl-L-alanine amidase
MISNNKLPLSAKDKLLASTNTTGPKAFKASWGLSRKIVVFLLWVTGILALPFCTRHPYKSTNASHRQQVKALTKELRSEPNQAFGTDSILTAPYWVGTTNFGLRKPSYVIIHHTAQHSTDETLKTFTLPRTQVSAHYVIGKDGRVFHMLNDYFRSWHAGNSRWGNQGDLNSFSIGIELDNNGYQYFDSIQINSLLVVLDRLKKTHNIPAANFIGHGDIAPTRKNDPNWRFPWALLAQKGFGLWYDSARKTVPEGFQANQALRIIGYDMRDTTAAQVAFKRHFLQDTTRGLNERAREILFNLQQKYF